MVGYRINTSDELYHHGVLGMKWGVRRYQNKDGSLTSAGEKRYGKSNTSWAVKRTSKSIAKKAGVKIPSSGDIIKKIDSSAKNISDEQKLSFNERSELKSKGHRLRLERMYRDKGLSASEARLAADKRIKCEKVVAAAAGVTVAACIAYYARNKYLNTYCDTILKKRYCI